MENGKSEFTKLCYQIASYPEAIQIEAMEKLQTILSPKEYNALLIGIAYIRMELSPKLKQAIKTAIAKQLYSEFTGKELTEF